METMTKRPTLAAFDVCGKVAAFSYGVGRGLVCFDGLRVWSVPGETDGPVAVADCPVDLSGVFRADSLAALADIKGRAAAFDVVDGAVTFDGATVAPVAGYPLRKPKPDDWTACALRVNVDPATLAAALEWTARAATKDATRYAIRGVRAEIVQGDGLQLVATDGRRLHAAGVGCVLQSAKGCEPKAAAMIGARSVAPLVRMLKKKPGACLVDVSERGWTRVRVGAVSVFYANAGTFPDWRQIVPAGVSATAAGDVQVMYERCRDAGRLLPKKSDLRAVRLDGARVDGEEPWGWETLKEAGALLNVDYLADALRGSWDRTSSRAWIHAPGDESRPVRITRDAGARLALIMPIAETRGGAR